MVLSWYFRGRMLLPRFSGSSAKNYRRVKVAPVGSSPSKSPSSLPSLASKSGEDSDSDEEEDNRVRDFSGIPSDSEDSDDKDDQDDKDDKDSDNDRKSNSMATDDEMHSFQSPAKAPASPSSLSSGGSPKIIAVLPQLKETRRREAAAAEILEFQRQLAIKSDEKVKAQEEGKAAAKELLPAPRKLEEGADWKKKTTEKERLMERVRAMQAAAAAAGEAGYIEAALQRTALLGKGGRGAVAEQQEQVIHVYTSDEDSENDDDRAKEQVIHVYTSAEDSENDDSANADAVQGGDEDTAAAAEATDDRNDDRNEADEPSLDNEAYNGDEGNYTGDDAYHGNANYSDSNAGEANYPTFDEYGGNDASNEKEYSEEAAYYENGAYYDDQGYVAVDKTYNDAAAYEEYGSYDVSDAYNAGEAYGEAYTGEDGSAAADVGTAAVADDQEEGYGYRYTTGDEEYHSDAEAYDVGGEAYHSEDDAADHSEDDGFRNRFGEGGVEGGAPPGTMVDGTPRASGDGNIDDRSSSNDDHYDDEQSRQSANHARMHEY
jgi:hypothetical protein